MRAPLPLPLPLYTHIHIHIQTKTPNQTTKPIDEMLCYPIPISIPISIIPHLSKSESLFLTSTHIFVRISNNPIQFIHSLQYQLPNFATKKSVERNAHIYIYIRITQNQYTALYQTKQEYSRADRTKYILYSIYITFVYTYIHTYIHIT